MTGMTDAVTRGKEAAATGAWAVAYEALSSVDPATLEPDDLDLLADAAWWTCDPHESIRVRQHAYAAFAAVGQDARAGEIAARLAVEHFSRGMVPVGSGWLAKAHRHLDDEPESRAHAFLWTIEATVRRYGGDLDGALEFAERAATLALRLRDGSAHAMAIHTEGMIHIAAGRIPKGLSLLDEAMASVLAGELNAYLTGIVYCNVIGACLEVADLRRAGAWSAEALDWCDTLSIDSPFHAHCRVNRAHVARLAGSWAEAEAEAALAVEELERSDDGEVVWALSELGEIRRRRGDLAGAAVAYERAHAFGVDPQPGLALLALARGRKQQAAAALRLARDQPLTVVERARLLTACVDVAIACEELDEARTCVNELLRIVAEVETQALRAMTDQALGAVYLAEGEPRAALEPLRLACIAWVDLRLPYEQAQARVVLGIAMRASGDGDGGMRELEAASEAFQQLGARHEVEAIAAILSRDALPAGLTAREGEVLRLVASGRTNRDIAVELVLSQHTIGRHLQNIYGKIGVNSRAAATAFAFEHDLA